MAAGAAATTIYDVVTRYRVENLAAGQIAGYDTAVTRASRSTHRLQSATRGVSRSFMLMGRMLGPVIGTAVGIGAVGLAGAKSFKNLNVAMNNTIQLAAMLNLAFKYTADPAENFLIAMTKSRDVFKDLVRDAAALPGEMSDFLGIGRMIAGPLFAAGGSTDQFRKLIAKIALATPGTGGGFDEAGRGAMLMLQGAIIRRNPLFRFLSGGQLLQGYEDVGKFNALDAASRFRILDKALGKIVDNPMFRTEILGTFDTQLGTLSDALFGISGIGGQLFSEGFQDILSGLTNFNVTLAEKTPSIVSNLRGIGGSISDLFGLLGHLPWEVITAPLRVLKSGLAWDLYYASKAARRINFRENFDYPYKKPGFIGGTMDVGLTSLPRWKTEANTAAEAMAWSAFEVARKRKLDPRYIANPRLDEDLYKSLMGFVPGEAGGVDGEHRETGKTKVTQNFHIKVAISTDESPEAVAVKIRTAMGKAAAHPTVAGRGVKLLPGGGSGGVAPST